MIVDETQRQSVRRHVDQWRHNRRFAKTIARDYLDWQVTVIFYTALHLIDAALASLGLSVSDHAERNRQVRSNESFAGVRRSYLDLYRISRITRYDADPDQWLPERYLTIADLAEDLLKPIETTLGPLIDKSVRFDALPLDH